ncbi:MAG TPA: type II toxin-antitoxin system HicA family toxin [bacterium]|nr:type II toxin-antitoxin system HicA family toxin [bacterium]
MQRLSPIKRAKFIQKLKKLGFQGPVSGAKHQFMIYKSYRLAIPSNKEYSVPQIKFMLKEIEDITNKKITIEIWNNL